MAKPALVEGRSAIRLKIDPLPDGADGCPLTVDLYRSDSLIDAVILYTTQGPIDLACPAEVGVDFDEYVAARYGRLIERAVLLGCAEGEARTYVDQVLLEQRKQIRRAEDPDPLVHEALERAISGHPAAVAPRSAPSWPSAWWRSRWPWAPR